MVLLVPASKQLTRVQGHLQGSEFTLAVSVGQPVPALDGHCCSAFRTRKRRVEQQASTLSLPSTDVLEASSRVAEGSELSRHLPWSGQEQLLLVAAPFIFPLFPKVSLLVRRSQQRLPSSHLHRSARLSLDSCYSCRISALDGISISSSITFFFFFLATDSFDLYLRTIQILEQ